MVLHNLLHSQGYNFQERFIRVYGNLCGPLEIPGGLR